MTILDDIISHKQTELPNLHATKPNFPQLEKKRLSLYETLVNAEKIEVIAEMKRASPSKGNISIDTDPVEQALTYEKAGAACISVLCETKYFKGSYNDLHAVAAAVDCPVLCKDFIIDPVQIDYAKAAGASVILLIVAALTDEQLLALHSYAVALNLEVLVEVHSVEELQRALQIDAKIIGVNNRNLKTFTLDLMHTEQIAQHIPANSAIAFISESGIWTSEDAARVAKAGAKGILVGEALMRSLSIVEQLQSFQVDTASKVGDVL